MRNILWHSDEVDILTGGRSTLKWAAYDLTLCAKDVCPGDLFFASSGDDLARVFADGAAAAVVAKDCEIDPKVAEIFPLLRVPCVYEALRALSRAARFRTHSLVIGVQGHEQRCAFGQALGAVVDYYDAGRHLSSSMAAMPEDCEFSVFGLTPSVAPDVAVIDRCDRFRDCGVFEVMPDHGIVLLNGDDPKAPDVLAMAQAAGLRNILTFGRGAQNDAYLADVIDADNGCQMGFRVFDQDITVQRPPSQQADTPVVNLSMLLASFLIAHLSDLNLEACAPGMALCFFGDEDLLFSAPQSAERNITLFPNAAAVAASANGQYKEAIFKVKRMVDTGLGQRSVWLDTAAPDARDLSLELPSRVGGLSFVRSSKKVSVFHNARKAIEGMFGAFRLKPIVPDVLSSGDYVVFQTDPISNQSWFGEALRPDRGA